MTVQMLYESGRLPHALLLLGTTADYAVKLHLCESEHKPCNVCDCCRRVDNKTHPDVVLVKESMPEDEKTKVRKYKSEKLREVIASGNLRPQFGDVRVFVFNDFDTMDLGTSQGIRHQNSLLKFIEEPFDCNRFVLTANTTSKILPTILSRVVTIRNDAPENDAPSAVADSVVAALLQRREYEASVAASSVKDRAELTELLQALLRKLSAVAATSQGENAQRLINATDITQKYIKRTSTNPNVQLAAAACTAELYSALHG